MGSEVEVVSGLSAQDSVIANPPDSIVDGEAVKVVPGSESATHGNPLQIQE